jgi:superfamily II DNA or RNA helicase
MNDDKEKRLITNIDTLLKEAINDILPYSPNVFFLVGYFYFSGFEQIYRELKDKHVKILVGMDIEHDIDNKIREFELLEKVEQSRGSVRANFNRSLVRLFNDSDFFDGKEKEDAFRLYLEKIKNGSLEIRKTLQPNHAKMYLFEYNGDLARAMKSPGMVITGSSNLSRAGLKDRGEVNAILRDPEDYKEGKKFFDMLWKDAVDIAGPGKLQTFEDEVVKKIWLDKETVIKPFGLYVRVLDELFSIRKHARIKYPAEISRRRYFNLKYQTDAVDAALSIINKYDGVIVSDVVGLGKSIVASVVAYNLGLKTIIIAPPHLRDQWEAYRWDFDFNARVYSSGAIERALEENDPDDQCLIVIDEAHKYRNEDTASYGLLHRLCQKNKVILLTATPYSNKPQDIFSMIKLFQVPARSTIRSVDNLSLEFTRLIRQYKEIEKDRLKNIESPEVIKDRIKSLAEQIRQILAPLIIRRTRLDLEAIDSYRDDLKEQAIVFPTVHDPISLEYDLGPLAQRYLDTLSQIDPDDDSEGFIGARYKPVSYLKDFKKYKDRIAGEFGDEHVIRQAQLNMANLMRRLLVSRLESSVFAFQRSLHAMIASSARMLDWFDKAGLVPIYKRGDIPDVEELLESDDGAAEPGSLDTILEDNIDKLKEKGFEFIPANELKKAFKEDIIKDIALLERIRDGWFPGGAVPADPKLDHFAATAKTLLAKEPGRKLAVYTSYADTANYLYQRLRDSLPVFKYTGADATIGNKRIIKENFDAGWPVRADDYKILIATDAISEGYNLHRAGAVFNYDIPFNPTRVIQRVGRINRVNKKVFDELYIYNFFPTDIGEQEVKIKRISTLKKAMIDALLGEDTRVLTSDEELNSFFTKKMREEQERQEELSWDTPYRNFLERLERKSPEILQAARQLPRRARLRRSVPKDIQGVIVFAKKGDDYVFKLGENPIRFTAMTPARAIQCLEAEANEKGLPVTPRFYDTYDYVKANLFSKRTLVPMVKGKQEAVQKVSLMIKKLPARKDYLEDLLAVIRELDALPAHFARMIRRVSFDRLEQDAEDLRRQIPHRYLMEIMEKARKVDDGVEYIIFAEEFA